MNCYHPQDKCKMNSRSYHGGHHHYAPQRLDCFNSAPAEIQWVATSAAESQRIDIRCSATSGDEGSHVSCVSGSVSVSSWAQIDTGDVEGFVVNRLYATQWNRNILDAGANKPNKPSSKPPTTRKIRCSPSHNKAADETKDDSSISLSSWAGIDTDQPSRSSRTHTRTTKKRSSNRMAYSDSGIRYRYLSNNASSVRPGAEDYQPPSPPPIPLLPRKARSCHSRQTSWGDADVFNLMAKDDIQQQVRRRESEAADAVIAMRRKSNGGNSNKSSTNGSKSTTKRKNHCPRRIRSESHVMRKAASGNNSTRGLDSKKMPPPTVQPGAGGLISGQWSKLRPPRPHYHQCSATH